jgi:hypothetical protein
MNVVLTDKGTHMMILRSGFNICLAGWISASACYSCQRANSKLADCHRVLHQLPPLFSVHAAGNGLVTFPGVSKAAQIVWTLDVIVSKAPEEDTFKRVHLQC